MKTQPQLTAAGGTPEAQLPGSPALTAREDDIPARVRRIIVTTARHNPESMEVPC